MADAKISALTNLTAADAINDMIPIVDVSDTPPASGNTKRISINNLLSSSPTASGALTVTGLVTAGSAAITGAATVGTTLGVTGVSTLASAVITGALTVDSPTLVVNAAGYTDKVGIGTVTPAVNLTVRTTHAVATATTYTGGFLIHDEPNGIGAHFNAGVAYDGGNQHSWIQSNSSTGVFPLALNPAGGDVRIGDNLVMLTSGKGIDFSATAGTGTSELLADYEEGTFTPTAGDASSGGNQATTVVAVGRYTKIGRLVTVHFELADINTTGLTAGNAMYVRGLPFAASSALTQFGTIAGRFITFTGFLTSGVYNGSAFPIYATSTGVALADIKVSGFASGTSAIFGTLTYFV